LRLIDFLGFDSQEKIVLLIASQNSLVLCLPTALNQSIVLGEGARGGNTVENDVSGFVDVWIKIGIVEGSEIQIPPP